MNKNLSALAPANGANAIVNAAFAIELDTIAPDPSLLSGFSALAPQLAEDGFGPPQPQQVFMLTVGPQMMTAGQSAAQIGGYLFQKRNSADQPVIDFSLRGNSISAVVHQYTRWHLIWAEVRKLFERVTPLVVAAQARPVRSIALQYIDKFTWREEGVQFPIKDVLRSPSVHFAPVILEKTAPWHSNIGCETECSDEWAGKRLDNLNMSLAMENGYPALTIFTIYRYFSRVSAKGPANFVTADMPRLFEEAHSENKKVLREVLADDVCEKINLNAKGHSNDRN